MLLEDVKALQLGQPINVPPPQRGAAAAAGPSGGAANAGGSGSFNAAAPGGGYGGGGDGANGAGGFTGGYGGGPLVVGKLTILACRCHDPKMLHCDLTLLSLGRAMLPFSQPL